MANKFRFKQKVKIESSKKADGRFNFGHVVGIELIQDAFYLGYKNESEYLRRFSMARYKVAYIDCVTERACNEWFEEHELDVK